MISKETLHLIGLIVNYPSKYCLASSFSWDESRLQCIVTKGSRLRWKIGAVLLSIYFLFLVAGLVNHVVNFDPKKVFEVIFHIVFVLSYFSAMSDKFNYFRCKDFYVPTVNGLLQYFEDFSEEYIQDSTGKIGGRALTLVNYCIKMCSYNIFCMPILILVHYSQSYQSSVYYSSLLLDHPFLLKILICPIAFLNMFINAGMISDLTFNSVMTILPLYFYTSSFRVFRYSERPSSTNLSNRLKSQRKITGFVRTAQIVEIYYGNLLQGRVLPLHFALSYLTIVCLFSFIRFNSRLRWELNFILFSTGLSALSGWVVVLWFLGRYFTSSQKFLNSWKNAQWPNNSQEKKLMKKFFRSCKPIEFVTVPRILSFRPKTVIKYIHFVNWAIAKCLIAAAK